MINILFIIAILGGIAFVLLVIQKHKKELAIQAKRDEHLNLLNSRIEEMAQNNPNIIAEEPAERTSHCIRELWGYPPKQNVVFEEITSGKEVVSGWDYAVHFHEGSEQYLGLSQFKTLEERFAAIPGVDKCHQEDREVFLVRAKRLSSKDIRKLFWEQYLLVAEAAIKKR